jgi:hypothetical protein
MYYYLKRGISIDADCGPLRLRNLTVVFAMKV